MSLPDRLADAVASTVGSWRFILIQSALLIAWICGNALIGRTAWDPYPFILLNLILSFQAAYTAPIIMMSQNRQSDLTGKGRSPTTRSTSAPKPISRCCTRRSTCCASGS